MFCAMFILFAYLFYSRNEIWAMNTVGNKFTAMCFVHRFIQCSFRLSSALDIRSRRFLSSLYCSRLLVNFTPSTLFLCVRTVCWICTCFRRGSLLSAAIFVYAATSPINGYTSGSMYARFGGILYALAKEVSDDDVYN